MVGARVTRVLLLLSLVSLTAPFAFAQQTGSIAGRVTGIDGSALPGVTIEARSTALPQPRVTLSSETGDYRLPALQVGRYTVTFSLAGMQTATRNVQVLLDQEVPLSVALGVADLAESITVTASASLVDNESTALKSAVSGDVIEDLPIGQDYRDLVKLAPAVTVSEEKVRGPSSGGSGQDNVYLFDGVNVTLPLFGTLSAEPASHDIDQVSVIKGGARAVDFNRAGGFQIDSVSKSGTSQWSGQAEYRIQSDALTSDVKGTNVLNTERDDAWATIGVGGPILPQRLFFYGSYYRPTIDEEVINRYGAAPDYRSTRNEWFGKLTYTPISNILMNGSYRNSTRRETAASIGVREAPTVGSDNESGLRIGTFEGSWIVSNRSLITAKFTDFANQTTGVPGLILNTPVSTALGTRIDIANLQNFGYFSVPVPIAGQTAYNAFIQPLIQQYGYVENGVRTGGGAVGAGTQFNDNDFFRVSGQVAYDVTIGTHVTHDLHFGYQRIEDAEDLLRSSNGWGQITVPGGRTNCPAGTACAGKPVFFQAEFQPQSIGAVGGTIRSEYEANNFELNDTIRWKEWTFNVGLLASNDTMYGQGLRENPATVSGYEPSFGSRYRMYELGLGKMLQPRLGAAWSYNGQDNVYASYARYMPAASSLPRAASWARNLFSTVRTYFDETGALIGSDAVSSSSGKLFQDDLTPRTVNEYLLGTAQQITPTWSARLYGRHRYTNHFWEDTNNTARIAFNPPPGIPRELYIPNLTEQRNQIGSGSTYVIAELDGAFTRYYEATVESDWRGGNTFVRGSYTFSHYYGNFDQDNTTSVNDANAFIGSSFIADGAGRQLWNFRYGRLRGDRPHLLKLYGSHALPWNATAGAFAYYQSGHPWEAWSYEPYVSLTSNTSDTSRYAEPAGRRRTPNHYQLDLNYTQSFAVFGSRSIQIAADIFNVFDRQTGYNPQPAVHAIDFGQHRSSYSPRRIQIAARVQF
jgi:hypothetical protein